MEDPVAEIPTVIKLLTQSPPALQQKTLTRFFTPSAAFIHPFCRTGAYDLSGRVSSTSTVAKVCQEGGSLPILSSRALMGGIYRWYKVLSPTIELGIDSVAFDETNLILYVSLHQTFRLFFVPGYRAPVSLVTVLNLEREPRSGEKPATYRITCQNDRYQVDEWIKFVSVFRVLWACLILAQLFASLLCVVGQAAFRPLVWGEEWLAARRAHEQARRVEGAKANGNGIGNGDGAKDE